MVDEKNGCGQGLDPVGGWHERVNEKGLYGVINSVKHALSLPVLRGSVWAGQACDNAMLIQKSEECVIDKLSAVVSLEGFNGKAKLSANVGMKSGDGVKNIRLLF
jgi:hypothetical protein